MLQKEDTKGKVCSRKPKDRQHNGHKKRDKKYKRSLFMLNKLLESARLRVNNDKTEAIWLGSNRSCHYQLLPDKHLSWNFSGKLKLLGISFNLSESDKTLGNLTETFQSRKQILNL